MEKLMIQDGDEVREMTEEEIAAHKEMTADQKPLSEYE
jgi:hypothetical protein